MKGKKGFSMFLVGAILAVVVVIVMLFGAGTLFSAVSERGDIESCRSSVLLKATLRTDVHTNSLISAVDCPTQYLDVKEDGIFRNDERVVGKDYTEDDVKRQIANELYTCWYKWGQGEIDPFDRGLVSGADACVVCSEIAFEAESAQKVGGADKTLHDFSGWLQTHDIGDDSIKQLEREETYYNYLTRPYQIKQTASVGSLRIGFVAVDKQGLTTDYVDDIVMDRTGQGNKYLAVLKAGVHPVLEWSFGEGRPDAIITTTLIEEKNLETLGCDRLY